MSAACCNSRCIVDVRDVAVLELRVYTDYNGANGSRAVWLERGKLRMDGDVDRVLAAYRATNPLDSNRGAP